MKTIVFGTGNVYRMKKRDMYLLCPDLDLVAFLDNDPDKMEYEGIPVYRPDKVKELVYDQILLMSKKSAEMREQLLELGVPAGAVYDWNRFCAVYMQGLSFYCGNEMPNDGMRIMVLSTVLGYDGGSIAATYAVRALMDRGYEAILVAEGGNLEFVNEIKKQGISVVLYPGLKKMGPEERYFIRQFDRVIVNVFQMVYFAVGISRIRPTLWWIHEVPYFIEKTIRAFPECTKRESLDDLNIYAVSPVAQNAFHSFYPDINICELPYGIPDRRSMSGAGNGAEDKKIVFALVGTVEKRKAQDVFLMAIKKLDGAAAGAEYRVIGSVTGTGEFQTEVRALAKETDGVKMTGPFKRDDLEEIYRNTDVLVCPSRLDPLPIVCTEAMMFGKPVIVSDNTGTAAFVKDGWNGFVCKTEDVEDLASKMRWCIENRDKLSEMGKNVRKTYEEHFSMDAFGDRLEKALTETEHAFAGE